MKMIIYKITCLGNNKVYIGQTIDLKQRIRYHKTYLKRNAHSNSYLQRSWNKYGSESFKFEIIEICSNLSELNQREEFWIKKLNSVNSKFGFNVQLGGHSDRPSERGLKKLRLKAMRQNRKVKQFNLKGEKIAEFESLKKAAKMTNCTSSEIMRACKGELEQVKNFQWRYFEDNSKVEMVVERKKKSSLHMQDFNKKTKSKSVIQKTLDGLFIREYRSIAEAVKFNKFKNRSQITNCLTKRPYCYSAYGFLWEYT